MSSLFILLLLATSVAAFVPQYKGSFGGTSMILFAGPEIEVVSQPDKVCALVPDALCHLGT